MGDKPDIHQVVLEAVNSIRLDGESPNHMLLNIVLHIMKDYQTYRKRKERSRGFNWTQK